MTLTDELFTIWPDALFKKHVLLRLWFTGFKRNPVRLTTCALRKFGISRLRKYRALTLLEENGFISVECTRGENPLVTLKWVPIKKHRQ